IRLGSAGDPLRWYISQPPHSGPSTFQSLRLPSAVRTNAPLRVPTSTRTPLIGRPLSSPHNVRRPRDEKLIVRPGHICISAGRRGQRPRRRRDPRGRRRLVRMGAARHLGDDGPLLRASGGSVVAVPVATVPVATVRLAVAVGVTVTAGAA